MRGRLLERFMVVVGMEWGEDWYGGLGVACCCSSCLLVFEILKLGGCVVFYTWL